MEDQSDGDTPAPFSRDKKALKGPKYSIRWSVIHLVPDY